MDPVYLDYNKNLIKKLQRHEIETRLAKRQAEIAAQDRDERVRAAQEREEAVRSVLRALVGSVRRYGLNEKKFKSLVRGTASTTPTHGPQSVRHAVLFEETNRVLSRHGARGR